jgi:hypothetical protein
MDEKAISEWLYNYFYNLDDPPVTELRVKDIKIKGLVGTATLVYIYDTQALKGHEAKIEFDSSSLSNKDFSYTYI